MLCNTSATDASVHVDELVANAFLVKMRSYTHVLAVANDALAQARGAPRQAANCVWSKPAVEYTADGTAATRDHSTHCCQYSCRSYSYQFDMMLRATAALPARSAARQGVAAARVAGRPAALRPMRVKAWMQQLACA